MSFLLFSSTVRQGSARQSHYSGHHFHFEDVSLQEGHWLAVLHRSHDLFAVHCEVYSASNRMPNFSSSQSSIDSFSLFDLRDYVENLKGEMCHEINLEN